MGLPHWIPCSETVVYCCYSLLYDLMLFIFYTEQLTFDSCLYLNSHHWSSFEKSDANIFLLLILFSAFYLQPVQPQYYYGSKFGYVVVFKRQTEHEWKRVVVPNAQAKRFIHKDPSIPPLTEFEVKVKAFNSQGEGPYSQAAIIYSAQDGEYWRHSHLSTFSFLKAKCVKMVVVRERGTRWYASTAFSVCRCQLLRISVVF